MSRERERWPWGLPQASGTGSPSPRPLSGWLALDCVTYARSSEHRHDAGTACQPASATSRTPGLTAWGTCSTAPSPQASAAVEAAEVRAGPGPQSCLRLRGRSTWPQSARGYTWLGTISGFHPSGPLDCQNSEHSYQVFRIALIVSGTWASLATTEVEIFISVFRWDTES